MHRGVITAVVIVIVLFVAARFYFAGETGQPAQTQNVTVPPAKPAPPAEKAPAIKHPIYEIQVGALKREMPGVEQKAMPTLENSDMPLRQDLSGLFDAGQLKMLVFRNLIRRFVVTVDNLPRQKLPQQDRLVAAVPGKFVAAQAGGEDVYVLSDANYARYAPFVRLAESVDLKQLVTLYTEYYSLFQQAYGELGYPDSYFNDRLVEVISHLLAAPELQGPVKLVRPKVFYQFADPDLEKLSSGQKILIRMGPENERRVKIVLRRLLRMLVKS